MNDVISMKEQFRSIRNAMQRELTGMMLPQDRAKAREVYDKYYKGLLEEEGEYRQSLTEAEDYVLMAVVDAIEIQRKNRIQQNRTGRCMTYKSTGKVSLLEALLGRGKVKVTKSEEIDAEAWCAMMEKECEAIDDVMETYRTQVKRVVKVREAKEQQTLLNTYPMLTDKIAEVIRVSKKMGDEVPDKMKMAIQMMEESLENYGLKYNDGKITDERL